MAVLTLLQTFNAEDLVIIAGVPPALGHLLRFAIMSKYWRSLLDGHRWPGVLYFLIPTTLLE